jgi:nucleoside-diphosphate-sugar epimerase
MKTALVLPNEPILYLDQKQVKVVRGDILNIESLRQGMPEGKEVTVFHLAGMSSMWWKQNEIQYQINVIGTRNVCQVAIEKEVNRLVFTSSVSAYGYHSTRVSEKTNSNAMTCKMNYNRTKYLGEKEIHKGISKGLDAVIVNPCNIIGPYDVKGWSTLIQSVHQGNTRGASEGIGTFAHVEENYAATKYSTNGLMDVYDRIKCEKLIRQENATSHLSALQTVNRAYCM